MTRFLIALVLGCGSVYASAAPLIVTPEAVVGQTTVFRASLAGTSSIDNGLVIDGASGVGGSPGVFSGFDLDFLFLDLDGVFATAGDRVFASSFSLTTGTVRPTADPDFQPTPARPGPTFGSTAANTIDAALATLNVLDASFPADFSTSNSSGWLTLGDGGSLSFTFTPTVVLGPTSALFLGEVGGGGEFVNASVSINVVPEPGGLLLLGLGILGLALVRPRRAV